MYGFLARDLTWISVLIHILPNSVKIRIVMERTSDRDTSATGTAFFMPSITLMLHAPSAHMVMPVYGFPILWKRLLVRLGWPISYWISRLYVRIEKNPCFGHRAFQVTSNGLWYRTDFVLGSFRIISRIQIFSDIWDFGMVNRLINLFDLCVTNRNHALYSALSPVWHFPAPD